MMIEPTLSLSHSSDLTSVFGGANRPPEPAAANDSAASPSYRFWAPPPPSFRERARARGRAMVGAIMPLGREKNPTLGAERRGKLAAAMSAAPGLLAGAGVMMVLKSTAVVTTAATIGVPAVIGLGVAGVVAGEAFRLYNKNRRAKISGQATEGLFDNFFSLKVDWRRLGRMGFHGTMGVAGGTLFAAAADGLQALGIDGSILPFKGKLGALVPDAVKNLFHGSAPVAVPAPQKSVLPDLFPESQATPLPASVNSVPVAPSVATAGTALEKAATLDTSKWSDRAVMTLQRALKGSAQAVKDLGFFGLNHKDGVDMTRGLAKDLFHQAADAGNAQAIRDLKDPFLSGIPAAPSASDAADKLAAVKSEIARQHAQELAEMAGGPSVSDAVSAPVATPVPETPPTPAGKISAKCDFFETTGPDGKPWNGLRCPEPLAETVQPGDSVEVTKNGKVLPFRLSEGSAPQETQTFLHDKILPLAAGM